MTDPTPVPPSRPLPKAIGRYRIVRRLGRGAMGVVYSAQDDVMERPVAVKVMMTDLEGDPETSARFYREARAAGQLVHRNIITIFDMGEDDGRPFIVMELLQGHMLGDYLQRPGGVGLEQKVDLMIEICEGLSVAHNHGIFHRDIKPGNLFVREEGGLKILDFGIARLQASSMTASGLIIGTPDYMSPEQARGDDVDQRSDVFSAGAVFYFMLTGRKPFAAPDLPVVLRKVEHDDPLPIRESEAPPVLARILAKALIKDARQRYQRCEEIIADLTRFKRDFDAETRRLKEDARGRLTALNAALAERRRLAEQLDIDPPPSEDGVVRAQLAERHPLVAEWVTGSFPLTSPARAVVLELAADLADCHLVLHSETERLQAAAVALDEGGRALAAGHVALALGYFDAAVRSAPGSPKAAGEAERCRRLMTEQETIDNRVKAIFDEAERSLAAGRWSTAVALCDDALALDGGATQVTRLRERAFKAEQNEKVERQLQIQRALDRAETYRRRGEFDEAARALAHVRKLDPESPLAMAFEAELERSRLDARKATERERQAIQAIANARATFSTGQHEVAISGLRDFLVRQPRASAVADEVGRLSCERERIDAEKKRNAETGVHLAAAEEALATDDAEKARQLAGRALAIDPHLVAARAMHGLATARLREQVDAKARSDAASRHLQEAEDWLKRAKYQKARDAVAAALKLTAASEAAAGMAARITVAEAQAVADQERDRAARQQAKAAAPVLDMARKAEAVRDFAKAAWMAENALALDVENAESREILRRARAELASRPAPDDDDTREVGQKAGVAADPDDTGCLGVPLSPWQRLSLKVRHWSAPAGSAGRPPRSV